MSRSFLLSGLVVAADVALPGAASAGVSDVPDIVVERVGDRAVPEAVASGRMLQAVTWGGDMQYSTVELDTGAVLLRLHGLVDFVIDPDLRTVRAWTDPQCEPEMLGILVAGNMLATVLTLRGETVLHASAVDVGGLAVAFVGHSGMGKSTLAALACARGARLVTDDLLRLSLRTASRPAAGRADRRTGCASHPTTSPTAPERLPRSRSTDGSCGRPRGPGSPGRCSRRS